MKRTAVSRLSYYNRVFSAYLTDRKSHLTFWHETPEVNTDFKADALGEYYMTFLSKADYPGHYDAKGIPQLDYHGQIGLQYNPIAIAQYGLGNYNLFCRTGSAERKSKFLRVAEWLVDNLEKNASGIWVWNHHFDWEYRTPLKSPWYSSLSQGQGISVLVRAFQTQGESKYLDAAKRAFVSFATDVEAGGVAFTDANGHVWFEEAIVTPPTHILNGFLWASWGIYDYWLATGDESARCLFDAGIVTLKENLSSYDLGFWSLYEHSGTKLKMIASHFYHDLHIVQLEIMHQLTNEKVFLEYRTKWDGYRRSPIKRNLALIYKAVFKLLYY